ncbi:STM2901 family protein [Burkholderia sp. A2]|uniref:STM2901 family protein n=1 Tax=Burkholderia sp. A2 TaxID=236253 RepID=UPI00084C4A76|nr:hypothetical protein A9Z05_17560 [Burkholderia sp. A2]
MSDNRYSYEGRLDLTPGDLFFWGAVNQVCKRFGFHDLGAAAAVLLGQNDVPVPGKPRGAVAGTSVASLAVRKALPFNVGIRMPTITKAGAGGMRIATTRNLGAFVGRAVPVVDTVMLATDAAVVMWNTVQVYNSTAKPEDRVLRYG